MPKSNMIGTIWHNVESAKDFEIKRFDESTRKYFMKCLAKPYGTWEIPEEELKNSVFWKLKRGVR